MGGSVNLAIRTKQNDLQVRTVWTNSTPYFLKNIRVLRRDRKYLSGLFKKNDETNVSHLGPVGYGLMVIDSHKGYVLDMQNYSSLDAMGMFQIYRMIEDEQRFRAATAKEKKHDYYQDTRMDIEWILGLANNQAFRSFCFYTKDKKVERSWQPPVYHSIEQFYQDFYQHFSDLLIDADGKPDHLRGITFANIDWQKFGYTYKQYPCDEISSYFDFLQQLRDLEYTVGYSDLLLWREHIFTQIQPDEQHFRFKEKQYLKPFFAMLPKKDFAKLRKQYWTALNWFYSYCDQLQDVPMHYLIKDHNSQTIEKVEELFKVQFAD